ncbi:hypothetical protein [Bifidobacterium sp. ESL0819]|uniref:hypothetical protein n=1 Tax=Bifidobacterium sp. ESL0819 TaxID=3448589 RepID=UPI0040421560
MALCRITYRCGHTDTVEIKGINLFGRRKKKIARYRTIDCPACWAAKVRWELDSLPALEGSDEQVFRAADIREKIVEMLMRMEDEAQKDHDARDERGTIKNQKAVASAIAWLKAQASASWWIDHQEPLRAIIAASDALPGQGD